MNQETLRNKQVPRGWNGGNKQREGWKGAGAGLGGGHVATGRTWGSHTMSSGMILLLQDPLVSISTCPVAAPPPQTCLSPRVGLE